MDAVLASFATTGEWLTALAEQYPWLEPASAILGLIGTATAIVLWLHNRIVGKARRIRREVEEKNEQLTADLAALRSEVKRLSARLPEAAWAVAERERRDDNEESAIRALRRHMDSEGVRLSEMARQIARFHFGLVAGQHRDHHLVPAERFALLSFHLDPRHGEAGELLKEIQRLRGDAPFEHVQFTDDVAMPEEDPDYYGLPQTPDGVMALLDDVDAAIVRGRYRHADALAEVASVSARRWALGDREPLALQARYWRAMALTYLGHHSQALAEIDGTDQRPGILRLREQSPDRGPTHPLTLSTRRLRADILKGLGRYDQALAEIDGTDQRPGILRPREQSPDRGPTHPNTLSTRWLRADILNRLGRHHQALAEIDGTDQRPGILRLEEQSPDLGPTHPSTLATRSLRGAILCHLEQHEASARELRGVGAEQERALGPAHASTLKTGHRLATTLMALGRLSEAEELLRAVIEGRRDSLGNEHPDTRAAIADLERLRKRPGRTA